MDLQALRQLRDLIAKYFDLAELRDLCFDLGIEYDNIAGETLNNKVGELIEYSQRHQILEQLVNRCRELRPTLEWPTYTKEKSDPIVEPPSTPIAEEENEPIVIPPPKAYDGLPTDANILIDAYHAEAPFGGRLLHILKGSGFTFTHAKSAYTLEQLNQYAALTIVFHYDEAGYATFTETEIEMIRNYLHQGGKLLLVGLGWEWYEETEEGIEVSDYPFNHIVEGSGIYFSGAYTEYANAEEKNEDAPILYYRPFMANHPITEGINTIGDPEASPGSLVVNAPAIPLIWGDNKMEDSDAVNSPILLAAAHVGQGRLVCLHHINYVTHLDEAYDNVQLLCNILQWLIAES